MRSGEGELRFSDGGIVRTTFKDDLKHGKGSFTDAAGKIHETIYYMDCEIRLGDQNPDCWGLAPLNFVLSVLVLILVYLYLITPYNGEGYLVGAIIFYIFLLIETCCTSTASFLSNITSFQTALEHLNN